MKTRGHDEVAVRKITRRAAADTGPRNKRALKLNSVNPTSLSPAEAGPKASTGLEG